MRAFGSRTVSAGLITAVFAALAWADWIGAAGAKPSWWLLPVAVALAFGGAEELVRGPQCPTLERVEGSDRPRAGHEREEAGDRLRTS